MLTAKELARYIISEIKKQITESYLFDVTPLKLQKLLYYVQGYSLALTGKSAFEEEIEARECGPIIESVYREYEKYNYMLIPYEEIPEEEVTNETIRGIVRLVLLDKNCYCGEKLAHDVKNEAPYRDSYKVSENGECLNIKIPKSKIRDYFAVGFQKREEDYVDEDKAWNSITEPVSLDELETAIKEI